MSIGKQVADAIEKMQAKDAEGALFAICAAVEATAAREHGRGGRGSYKTFIRDNLGIITDVAFGGKRILNIRLAFDHPEMTKNADGVYSVEDIFYLRSLPHDRSSRKPTVRRRVADQMRQRCDRATAIVRHWPHHSGDRGTGKWLRIVRKGVHVQLWIVPYSGQQTLGPAVRVALAARSGGRGRSTAKGKGERLAVR